METKFHSMLNPLKDRESSIGPGLLYVREKKKRERERSKAIGKPHHVENAYGTEKRCNVVLCSFS